MPGSAYGEINKSGMTESFVLGYVLLLRGCGIEAVAAALRQAQCDRAALQADSPDR